MVKLQLLMLKSQPISRSSPVLLPNDHQKCIPKFWTFGPYVSFVRWSYQGLMINRYNAFATDDSSTFDTGYGDPLGYFAFDGMSKNW